MQSKWKNWQAKHNEILFNKFLIQCDFYEPGKELLIEHSLRRTLHHSYLYSTIV